MLRNGIIVLATATTSLVLSKSAVAATFSLTVDGSDAIFLAGRTDLIIPPASDPWDVLGRHRGPTPEEIQETLPPFITVAGGDVVKVADPAIGGISFFNGFGDPFFGPSGNGAAGSNLNSLDGISGYLGPQGPLVGVFLDDSIPNISSAPATLNFTPSGLGTDFVSLSPALGQVFYIGDGVTSTAQFQEFIAPSEATRLFLGIPDGFGFVGNPGAYDDNDGSYQVLLGVNEEPSEEGGQKVPEPSSILGILALGVIAGVRKKLSPSKTQQ